MHRVNGHVMSAFFGNAYFNERAGTYQSRLDHMIYSVPLFSIICFALFKAFAEFIFPKWLENLKLYHPDVAQF